MEKNLTSGSHTEAAEQYRKLMSPKLDYLLR